MLPGQAPMAARPSGETVDPIEMPRSRKATSRARGGKPTGRSRKAASDTASIAPISQPAGQPRKAKSAPPAAASASVPAAQPKSRRKGAETIFIALSALR